MKIYFTPAMKLYPNNRQQNNKHEDFKSINYSYNPAAYQDYNISFGARLFRSPENFYEQDFNKEGMPKSLHRYIYNPDNFSFRRTIPPAQAMKEVFGSIADMQTLEDVKAAFPDEPLFKDLHSQSSRKARTGVLGELTLMRADEDYAQKSLFKNGDDDLGMYILKKIYVEGKTLKEINKDFHRDKSVVYKGLSDIQYVDIKAFGIHFPRQDFWKSFIATREDFPYVYIPRTVEGGHSGGVSHEYAKTVKQPVKKRFEDMKDWEIDKISDALIEGMGDQNETEKLLKKRNIRDTESLNFVAKYMGEINSVVLEKLHVSEEMKEFFDNYESLTKSQKQKFKDYWKNPETRELRSLVMSSTIKFFFDVYGVDGNNDEFQELLEYARGIKSKREAQELEHDRRQAEYDKMFAELDSQESKPDADIVDIMPEKIEKVPELTFAEKLKAEAEKRDGKVYDFVVDGDVKVSLIANLEQMMYDRSKYLYKYLPQSFVEKYTKFVLNHPKVTEDYLLALIYKVDNLIGEGELITNQNVSNDKKVNEEISRKTALQVKDQLMDTAEVNKISREVDRDFYINNKKQVEILSQALMELCTILPVNDDEHIAKQIASELNKCMGEDGLSITTRKEIFDGETFDTIKSDILKRSKFLRTHDIAFLNLDDLHSVILASGFTDLTPEQRDFISEKIKKYQEPLTKKEMNKINYKIMENLENYDLSKSVLIKDKYAYLYKTIIENMKEYPEVRVVMNKILKDRFVTPENTHLRYFLEENPDKNLIGAKTERLITEIISNETEIVKIMAAVDMDNIEKYIKPYDKELYTQILEFRFFSIPYLKNYVASRKK